MNLTKTDDCTVEASDQAESQPANSPSSTPQREEPRGGFALLRVLRHREFALFWGGMAVSLVGTWMQQFAQGWVVTNLTTSAFALGVVNFASSIPTLVLMPFGGVAADRMERRRILIYTQWVMAILAVVMGVLIQVNRLELWHVWVIALLLGIATAYDLPAYQSFYPQLVEPQDLPQAISLNQATFHGSRIIGPAIAAWFVARWGNAAAFYANGASFLAVIASLMAIRPRPPASGGGPTKMLGFMAEGVNYVRERPRIGALLGLTAITTMFVFPNMAILMPFYAQHVLNVGPGGLGWMMAVSGAGAFLGATILLTIPRRIRVGWIMASLVVITATLSVLAWSRHLGLSVGAVALQSFGISSSLGMASIMVQEIVPDALRGRVMSLYSLTFTGVMPFAALGVTRLADVIGMRRELQVTALLYGLCGAALMVLLWSAHQKPDPDAEIPADQTGSPAPAR